MTAVAGHAGSNGVVFSPDETDTAPSRIDATSFYRAFQARYPDSAPQHFALTCPFAEDFYGIDGFDLTEGARVWRHHIVNLAARRNGWISRDDELWFGRQLFLSPPNPETDQHNTGVYLAANPQGDNPLPIDLIGGVRPQRVDGLDPFDTRFDSGSVRAMQINATFPDLPIEDPGQNSPGFRLFAPQMPGSRQFLNRHSAVFYREGASGRAASGTYLSTPVGENSWSLSSMWIDQASGGGKTYSTEQLARLLDASTVHPDQPSLVIVFFATEPVSKAEMISSMRLGISRWDTAHDMAGLPAPHYLLLGNPAHRILGSTWQQSEAWVLTQNAASLEVAQTHPRAGFISLYNLSDGQMFAPDGDTSPGNTKVWRQWLRDNGWDQWMNHPGGAKDLTTKPRLWDIFGLHPWDEDSSDFWWELALREFNEGTTPTRSSAVESPDLIRQSRRK